MAVTGRGRQETCLTHPDRPAVVRCWACHKPLCAACVVSTAEGKFCSHKCSDRTADFRAHYQRERSRRLDVGKIVRPIVWLIVIFIALCVVNRYIYKIPAIGEYLWSGNKESEPSAKEEKSAETGGILSQAAAVVTQVRQSDAVKNAQKQYESGQGEQAVETLTAAGMGDSQMAHRIRDVIAAKARANEAIRGGHFPEAKAALEEIFHLEPVQTNPYVLEAKRNLDGLPAEMKEYAGQLVRQADEFAGGANKEYRKARDAYVEALRLDSNNKQAQDGLNRLYKSARLDFGIAINRPRDTLDQVNAILQMLQSVQDRLREDDRLSDQVRSGIEEVQSVKTKLESQGGQKGP